VADPSPSEERGTFKVTVAQTGQVFEVRHGERLLAAARRSGVWLPFECGWGSCGTCKIGLVEGTARLLFPDAPSWSERDERRSRILACQSSPTSDLTIRPFRVADEPTAGLATRDEVAELIKVEPLGPDINRFVFRLDEPAHYLEGQYACLELAPGLRRCYSMEDLSGTDAVSFIAKRYDGGEGSNALFALEPSAHIAIEFPYGGMWVRSNNVPCMLIAGGTGISPIRAIVRRLVAADDPRPIQVYYGAGSTAELVAWDELDELVGQLPDGTLHGTVVSPDATWAGSKGLVTDALRSCSALEADDTEVYIAGPPIMVDAVLGLLKECGVGMNRINYDRFG
jgi:NAD(P)H-flavin reductase/ferredoxin